MVSTYGHTADGWYVRPRIEWATLATKMDRSQERALQWCCVYMPPLAGHTWMLYGVSPCESSCEVLIRCCWYGNAHCMRAQCRRHLSVHFWQGRVTPLPPTSKWHFSLVAAWVVKQAGSSKLLAKLNAPIPAGQFRVAPSMVHRTAACSMALYHLWPAHLAQRCRGPARASRPKSARQYGYL